MDIGTFRGLITLVLLIAFLGLVWWAYSKRRKPDFDEAANLPFADEDQDELLYSGKSASSQADADSRHDRGDKNT